MPWIIFTLFNWIYQSYTFNNNHHHHHLYTVNIKFITDFYMTASLPDHQDVFIKYTTSRWIRLETHFMGHVPCIVSNEQRFHGCYHILWDCSGMELIWVHNCERIFTFILVPGCFSQPPSSTYDSNMNWIDRYGFFIHSRNELL